MKIESTIDKTWKPILILNTSNSSSSLFVTINSIYQNARDWNLTTPNYMTCLLM